MSVTCRFSEMAMMSPITNEKPLLLLSLDQPTYNIFKRGVEVRGAIEKKIY